MSQTIEDRHFNLKRPTNAPESKSKQIKPETFFLSRPDNLTELETAALDQFKKISKILERKNEKRDTEIEMIGLDMVAAEQRRRWIQKNRPSWERKRDMVKPGIGCTRDGLRVEV